MRRSFYVFILSCLSIPIIAQSFEGDSWTKVKNSGSGTLAVLYATEPGIIYKDSDGSIKGICADILTDFAAFVNTKYGKKLTINYVKDEANYPLFLSTVQNTPNLLGVSNVTITDDRKKVLKFTPPYLKNIAVLLTNQNSPDINNINQFNTTHADFSAEILKGSTHEEYIEKLKKEAIPKLKINYSVANEDIFKKLSTDPKSFTILDFTAYAGLMKQRKYAIKKHQVNLKIVEELGFIMSKQTDWSKPWEEFLTPDYLKSVRYKQIISENLGASYFALTK